MIETLETRESAVERFTELQKMLGTGPSALTRIREAGLAHFRETGLPTTKQEEWIYTSVAPIARTPFRLSEARTGLLSRSELDALTLAGEATLELVFVNGHYSEILSRAFAPTPVTARSLSAMLSERPEAVASHLSSDSGPFASLNAAFLEDGAFVSIPEGKVIDKPIHLVFVSTRLPYPQMTSPRVVILAGRNSDVKIVETFAGLESANYLTNSVTEIVLGENARADHTRVQLESEHAFHISLTKIRQSRDSIYDSHAIHFGGGLVRNEIHATLDGPGSECYLDGLFVLAGSQHVDNHTLIEHAASHATSNEHYKGILDGKSRGIFDGRIVVHKDAQKTVSRQTNNNLLLSNEAIVDSKPQLEIHADDVKCNHGSTIGQIDEEALFYLRSRGIGLDDARGILTVAFAGEIVERLNVETLRSRLQELLLGRISTGERAKDRS